MLGNSGSSQNQGDCSSVGSAGRETAFLCGWRGRTGLYTPIYNEPHESAGKHMICAWGVVVTGFGAPQQPLQLEACPPHPPLCWRLVHVRMCVCVCVCFTPFPCRAPASCQETPGRTWQPCSWADWDLAALASRLSFSCCSRTLGRKQGGGQGEAHPASVRVLCCAASRGQCHRRRQCGLALAAPRCRVAMLQGRSAPEDLRLMRWDMGE